MLPTSRKAAVLALAAGLALTACSDGTGKTPTQTSTSAASTSTSDPAVTTVAPPSDATDTTTEPPQLSAAEQDLADIEETLELYTRALDDAFNGEASVEGIYPFSRDTAREKWVTQVMASEAQGMTSTGLTELEMVKVEVSIDGDAAEVVACVDVSAVEVMDKNGDSIVPGDRLDRTFKDFVLERDDSAEVGWYVVEDSNRNEPCDG